MCNVVEPQVSADCAEVMAMIEPHAALHDAAADQMAKGGIGLHNPEGHVGYIRRMASSMRAEAAEGRVPHRYAAGLSRWD
jgi:hypothetical protein